MRLVLCSSLVCAVRRFEIVPLVLETADGALGFELQADPVHVVSLEREHLVELFFATPMGELGAVQEHHAAGHATATAFRARAGAAQDRLVPHVAGQQLPYVTGGEDVRIDDHRPALIAHQFRRHEAQRREGLEVIVEPQAPGAVAQVVLPVAVPQKFVIGGVDEADVELVGVRRVAFQRIARNERAHHLLVIGVDEDAVLHGRIPLAGGPHIRDDCRFASRDRARLRCADASVPVGTKAFRGWTLA